MATWRRDGRGECRCEAQGRRSPTLFFGHRQRRSWVISSREPPTATERATGLPQKRQLSAASSPAVGATSASFRPHTLLSDCPLSQRGYPFSTEDCKSLAEDLPVRLPKLIPI